MAEERASKRIKTHDGASSSTPEGSEYQVFLNFRGEDTRTNFTDHLYCKLTAAGIRTFRDNEGLRTGEEIGSNLLEAIERSTISIPIFSKGYASSKWCLTELTHMVKCMKTYNGRHTVCPVFYNVTPEVVKHQTGSFEEAFLKHKDEVNECTIQEWKDALKEVAELKGWEKDKIENGHEAKLVQEIVIEVCRKLKKSNVRLNDNLVGMDHHMDEMTQLLDINGDNGVRIVGILGMGGLGKTTIAKFMYNQLCDHFQRQCTFVEDVWEKVKRNGCAKLQEQLVSDVLKRPADEIPVHISNAFRDKKVLIVVDDVKDKPQLKEIIGSPDYFGPGSRIIVTTRNKEVFEESKGDLIYKPSGMNDDESLLLFCNYAFQSPQPSEGYGDISKQLARSAAGLPLSLRVIGSMLYEKEKPIWEETLKKLKVIPPDEVQQVLKISYDALEYEQQQIFLDIACHFIGEDQTDAMYMWDACEFFPKVGIDALVCLSLITIEKIDDEEDDLFRMSIFRMHDQLRDLGRYIVKKENRRDFGERSRLWSHQEAVDTLKNQSGTKKVQTLQIGNRWDSSGSPYCFSNDDFKEMAKLRYLDLAGAHLEGDFNGLLRELRWLKSRSMTVTSFIPAKLLILDLSESHIEDGWESSIEIKAARNLKVLNLKFCSGLTKTPDFSKFSNLERLMLLGCPDLTEIGSSVKHLTQLTYLNAENCRSLRKLPPEFGSMTALQQVFLGRTSNSYWLDWEGISELPDSIGFLTQLQCLSLRNCHLLEKIPDSFWNLKSLTELDISFTGIRKLSLEGVGKLEKLQVLNCSGCESLEGALPSGIGRLSSLRVLDLSFTKIDTLPDDVWNLGNLRKLNLDGSEVKKLPGVGIERLQKLEELNCSECESLKGALPSGIGRLSSLRVLDLSWTKVDTLPDDVGNLENLRKLNLQHSNVNKLPGVGTERLQKLEELNCSGCRSLEGALPSGIGRLSSLRVLDLSCTKVDTLPDDVRNLGNLRKLNLDRSEVKKLPGVGIEKLQKLEELDCGNCRSLEGEVPEGIWSLSSLRLLNLSYTKLDIMLPDDIGSLCNLRELNLRGSEVKKLPGVGIEKLQNLKELDCDECRSLEGELPDGIWSLPSLRRLILSYTKISGSLPKDISGMPNLRNLFFECCENLRVPAEELKLPLSLECLGIPLTEASLNAVRSLVNLKKLLFHKNVGYCCEPVKDEEVGVEMPSKLEYLYLVGFDDQMMSCGLLPAMKFDSSSRLRVLYFKSCNFETLPSSLDLSNCQMLEDLVIDSCRGMREIADFGFLWKSIDIQGCESLEVLRNLSNMKRLKTLKIRGCPELGEIKGIGEVILTSLEKLIITGCPLLKKDELHPYLLKYSDGDICFVKRDESSPVI